MQPCETSIQQAIAVVVVGSDGWSCTLLNQAAIPSIIQFQIQGSTRITKTSRPYSGYSISYLNIVGADYAFLDQCYKGSFKTIVNIYEKVQRVCFLKLTFMQYPALHTNYIISHCTTLQ